MVQPTCKILLRFLRGVLVGDLRAGTSGYDFNGAVNAKDSDDLVFTYRNCRITGHRSNFIS